MTGQLVNSRNSAVSSPTETLTGTWYSGGSATTTKPHVLIEPTGTTSTAWATTGTGLGVNAASGFTGNLLDLQLNGSSKCKVTSAGTMTVPDLTVSSGASIPSIIHSAAYNYFSLDANGLRFGSGTSKINFYDSISVIGTKDLGLGRNAAGILEVNSGTGGTFRDVLCRYVNFQTRVEANTAGSGSPNILIAAESYTTLTNEGTAAENYHTLPTAVAGYDFEFICQDADGIRITVSSDDNIRDLATVSATSTGYIRSSTIGSVIRLKAINATEWFVTYKQGTWTVDS